MAKVFLVLITLGLAGAAGIIFLNPHPLTPAGQLTTQLLPVVVALQAAAMLLSLASLPRPALGRAAWGAQLAATGLALAMVLAYPLELRQLLEAPHLGLSNLYGVSLLTMALTGATALVADHAARCRLLPFISPILLAAAGFSWWLASVGAAHPQELVPALQNAILPLHVLTNFVGYACFATAAGVAVAILVQHYNLFKPRQNLLKTSHKPPQTSLNLPSPATLEKIAYRLVAVGFPMFSLAILLGCVWAYQAWGGYWSWDPKETWALIVWLLYAAYLHARAGNRKRPHVLAWWLLVGFAATLFCYLGVNIFLSGLHSYGSLQP